MKLGDKGSNFKYRIIMKYQVTAWVTAEVLEYNTYEVEAESEEAFCDIMDLRITEITQI